MPRLVDASKSSDAFGSSSRMRIPKVKVVGWLPILLLSLTSIWYGRPGSAPHEHVSLAVVRFQDEPALYAWDFNEPLHHPYNATKGTVAATILPLTWEAIEFGATVGAMNAFYEGAMHPPVWNRTNWTHSIFYQVFVPESNTQGALDIVQEQVGQMAYAAPSNVVTPVYYSLIGPTASLYQGRIEEIFARYPFLSLHLLQRLPSGNEEVTLNYVRDYCVQQTVSDRTRTRVTYVHNKGSFHPEDYNHHWRRALTAGALHPDCLQPLESSTNACGLQFFTRFTVFFPGNMWTARCDFLPQLQPLREHTPQTIQVLETAMLMRLRHQVNTSFWRDKALDWYGVDRFANEHWLGTHPDLVPTDVDPSCSVLNIQAGNNGYAEYHGTTGRTLRCRGFVWGPDAHLDFVVHLSTRPHERLRDYFSFPEAILRWFTFYGRGPTDHSPIWTWFTDGELWKEAIRKHGMAAVTVILDKYGLHDMGRMVRTAFSSRIAKGSAALPKSISRTLPASKEHRIIFVHVVLPLTSDPVYQVALSTLSNQLQVISEAIQAASRRSSVYYTLVTRNATNVPSSKDAVQTACKKHAIDCIPLGDTVVDTDFVGETLWYAHQYCSVNPTSSITYLSNVILDVGGNPNDVEREQSILDLTRGALHKDCWTGNATCSTCGLKFSTSDKLHYKGNMFSARCDYVNKLIPPIQFEPKMNQWAGMVLAAQIRDKIVLGPTDTTPFFFGIDHFAIEHWIGSHPSIVPCDLAGDGNASTLAEWSTRTDGGNEYQGLTLPDDQRLRWYSLLPGNLMKWDFLYDAIPTDDSWIWRAFPDGEHWKNIVRSKRLRLRTL